MDTKIDAKTQAKLRADSGPSSPDFWDDLYKVSRFPWDLDGPTPVFQRLLREADFEPGKLLVLGAGRGHDARLFARHGFEVTAVDFSAEAVDFMNQLDDPGSPIEIIRADFFSLPGEWDGRFDYILDYTSFCAIIPSRRDEYADMVAGLLKPGGRYVILAFPIGSRPGGPPYSLQPDDIIQLYSQKGFSLKSRETPFDSAPGRAGYEQLLIMEKVIQPDLD